MIRSSQIPDVLRRICGDGIHSAALVTGDGELLGTSLRHPSESLANQSTLIAEIASDYVRLASELRQRSLLFVCLELDQGMVAIATAGPDFVMAICESGTPLGLLQGKVMACALHVQEALTPMVV
jgi:predicted regulator of Ras-like GTPase activity (Roadblock/LC7/MglB family)